MRFVLIGVINLFFIMTTIFVAAYFIGLVKSLFVKQKNVDYCQNCVAKGTQECSGDTKNCIKGK